VAYPQPQFPAQVRKDHPLARGLIDAYSPPFNNVSRVGAAVLKTGYDGIGFTVPVDTAYWQASTTGKNVGINPTWTILAIVNGKEVRAGGAGKGSAIYCERPDVKQIVKLELNALPAARLTVRDDGAAILIQLDQSGTLTGVRDVLVGTRRSTTDHRLYINGQFNASSGTTVANTFIDAAVYIGHDPLDATAPLEVASCPLLLIWNRALSDGEISRISANPWQIFGLDDYERPTIGGVTAATTATSAAGAATVSAVGASKAASAGTAAAGVATVGAAGAALSKAAATSADGAATVSAVGAGKAAGAATAAAGVATVSAVGAAVSKAAATSADGVATVSAAGASLSKATATAAAGVATVSAAGAGASASTATAAAGVATVSGAGASLAVTTATAAAGVAVVSAGGSSLAAADAVPAAGLATVSGAGSALSSSSSNAIPADGVATVSATASSLAAADPVAAAGVAFVSATTPDIPGTGGGHGSEFVDGSVIRRRVRRGPPISPMEANPHLRRKAEDAEAAREDTEDALRGAREAPTSEAEKINIGPDVLAIAAAEIEAARLAQRDENNRRAAILLALLMMEAA
jgi:hypothetical protein